MKLIKKIVTYIAVCSCCIASMTANSVNAASVRRGDVNLDGIVTGSDVLELIDYKLGRITLNPDAMLNADVDSDGEVHVIDLAYIKQFVMGDNIPFIYKPSTELTEGEYPASENYVKMLGRTYMKEDILWLAQSASGIEFEFTGTSAEITIVGDNSISGDSKARFAVYVNGERVMDELVSNAEKTYTVFSSEESKENTVRLVKLSESANSTIGIKNIKAKSVGDIAPTAYKDYTIEFIGDSITCGYGVDVEDRNLHFSTATEDATKTYAYQTAQRLNADCSLVSYSGYGVISGYTSVTPFFEHYGFRD